MGLILIACTTLATGLAAGGNPEPAGLAQPPSSETSLGQLDFAVTGSPGCRRQFREGMLALHSFLYDQARESFEAALAADAGCAMAAWGQAMTFDHPIWRERDLAKGRAALARVSGEQSLPPRERSFLAAARALYGSDDLKQAHGSWLAAATAMRRDYPADDEVALQHALALLSVYGYDPKHVREQMEAGAIALQVLERRPEHPGAAHYVIHSFDSRDHAILALPAARTYARIAPAAGHAQHMPSHTFVHLGMWRDVVPSNEKAYAASVAWADSHANTPTEYDWHSYSWLVAAHLELGQQARAKQLLHEARALLLAARDDTGDFRNAYADMAAAYLTQTDRWSEAEEILAPVLAPALLEGTGPSGPVACAMHAPGGGADVRMPSALFARLTAGVLRSEAAIRAGDAAAAEDRIGYLEAVRAQTAAWSSMLAPDFVARWEAVDLALRTRARAVRAPDDSAPRAAALQEAIAANRKIAEMDATRSSAGPAWLKPARETLGEILLSAGKPEEALEQFEQSLALRPNRAAALLGAARAATAAFDLVRARQHYASLADLWRDADPGMPTLAEVRVALK